MCTTTKREPNELSIYLYMRQLATAMQTSTCEVYLSTVLLLQRRWRRRLSPPNGRSDAVLRVCLWHACILRSVMLHAVMNTTMCGAHIQPIVIRFSVRGAGWLRQFSFLYRPMCVTNQKKEFRHICVSFLDFLLRPTTTANAKSTPFFGCERSRAREMKTMKLSKSKTFKN